MTQASVFLRGTDGGKSSITRAEAHLVDGLARVARSEFNSLVFITLALETFEKSSSELSNQIGRIIERIAAENMNDFEPEYRETDGILGIGRLVEAPSLNEDISLKMTSKQSKEQSFGAAPALALQIMTPGVLSSVQFHEASLPKEPLGSGQLEIKVEATGSNFRDCLIALGHIDSKDMGGECAGLVSRVGPECEFTAATRRSTLQQHIHDFCL